MKKLGLAIIALISPIAIWAQGLLFENGTFAEALAKAKAENKIVFMDVYTTWCGPCKQMAANLFPAKEAGDIYNKHFVNYKIDAEKGEGLEVAARYNVAGYPTNLFLRPDGSVVYTVMGAGDLPWFINNAKVAVEEAKDPLQWSDYEAQVQQKNPKKEFLKRYLAKGKRLAKNTDKGLDIYVSKYLSKKLTDDDLAFLIDYNQSMDNKAYALLAKNKSKIDEFGKDQAPNYFKVYSESLIRGTIEKFAAAKDETNFQKVVLGHVKKNSVSPNTDKWFYANHFYEFMGDEAKLEAFKLIKVNEIMALPNDAFKKEDDAKLKELFDNVAFTFTKNGGKKADQEQYFEQLKTDNPQVLKMASLRAATDLNEMAWNVFETNNKEQIKNALKWSTKSLELIGGTDANTRASFLDTYAHLLYRNGNNQEAIRQQEQALALAKSANNKDAIAQLEENLKKMQNGSL